tara:strand:- start:368 stop:718 length:351 start_codon:yes stop_codon:yes gene_type:complete
MKAVNHCRSSVKRFGGVEEDYHRIHAWFDYSKNYFGDIRHRAFRHHTVGVQMCEDEFGLWIVNSDDHRVPVKSIAEQHIREDLGFIPTLQDWYEHIRPQPWMASTKKHTLKKMNLM